EVPSIEAQLINSSDVVQDLTFTISSIEGTSTGTFSDSALPAGYYVLSVKLLDNNIQTMGAVEIVRIVEGETSTGSFIFNEINKPGGTIMANIIADMEEPIEVSMSDIPAELAKGTTPSVTASVPDGVGDVRYTWFINGEQKHIGSTADPVYTIPVDTLKTDGVYRIDVVAFTLDGKRGGSATDTFSVIEAEPQPGCTENVWEGNYTILTQAHIDALSGYAKITGNLEIGDSQAFMNNETPVETTFTNLAGLECLTRIEGYLVIINNNSLTNLTGLSNLTHIEKYVAVLTNNALTSLAGLNNLEVVNGLWEVGSVRMSMMFQENKALTDAGDFNKISSLSGGLAYLGNRVVSINGFNNLTSIGDELIFSEEPALKSIEGFSKLTSIDGRFSITKNDILTNIDGLNNITSVNHYLDIEENNALTSIGGFNELDNSVQVLSISSNPALTSIDGFNKLTSITSYFNITSNTALETINGFSSLTYIGNEIKIFRNTVLMNIEGFPALCSVGGYFTISENPELCTNIAEEFRDQVQNCSGGGIGGSISIIENKICP
ncbi:MAG: hypothetical protein GY754_05460, partial [bacterium]|nr:hypothetical protein [bacterium]